MKDEMEKKYKEHSEMLSRIASFVDDWARNENDSTLLCVLRAVQQAHFSKAEMLQKYIEMEEELSLTIK